MNCRWCGHMRIDHEHYRSGTDCGICGARKCPVFIRTWIGYLTAKYLGKWG